MIALQLSALIPMKDHHGNILIVLNKDNTLKLDKESAKDLAERINKLLEEDHGKNNLG